MFLWTLNNFKNDKVYCNSNFDPNWICLQSISNDIKPVRLLKKQL